MAITLLSGAQSYLAVFAVQLISGCWSIVIPANHLGVFQSRSICGGNIGEAQSVTPGVENLDRLTEITTRKLQESTRIIGEIIQDYNRSIVRFTYTPIECISNFSATAFDMRSNSHTDLGASFLQVYNWTSKVLSVLNLISSDENDRLSETDTVDILNKMRDLRSHIYEALCSMNKALRRLGYQGEEVSRQDDIEQTPNMCQFHSSLDRFVRDLELLKLLKTVTRTLFDRVYSNNLCMAFST